MSRGQLYEQGLFFFLPSGRTALSQNPAKNDPAGFPFPRQSNQLSSFPLTRERAARTTVATLLPYHVPLSVKG